MNLQVPDVPPIDVFVRVCILDKLRWAFALASIFRWRCELGINLKVIQANAACRDDAWG